MNKQPLILWIQYIALPTATLSNKKPQMDPADFGRSWGTDAAGVQSNRLAGSAEQCPSSPSWFPDGACWGKEIRLPVKRGHHIVLSGRGGKWAPKLAVWWKQSWRLNIILTPRGQEALLQNQSPLGPRIIGDPSIRQGCRNRWLFPFWRVSCWAPALPPVLYLLHGMVRGFGPGSCHQDLFFNLCFHVKLLK